MLACGYSHRHAAGTKEKPMSSMHYLAKSERKDKTQKQIGLLEMGLSPQEKDERGWTPLSHVKGQENKTNWLSVERSFKARNKAHNILEEMEKENDLKP